MIKLASMSINGSSRRASRVGARLTLSGLALGAGLAALPDAASAGTITRTIRNVTELQQIFAEADARPDDSYVGNVAAGTYVLTNPLKLRAGNLRLVGASSLSGAGQYVLDCRGACYDVEEKVGGRVITVMAYPTRRFPRLRIDGLTITGGNSTQFSLRGGGGAMVERGFLEIYNSDIRGNRASQWGAGLLAISSGNLTVVGSMVRDNENDQYTFCGGGQTSVGGGVAGLDNSSVYIERSSITGNKACRGGGVALGFGAPSDLVVSNTTISNNHGSVHGGGVFVWNRPRSMQIAFSTIAFNSAATIAVSTEANYGAGIGFKDVVFGPSDSQRFLEIRGTVIAENFLRSGRAAGANCYTETVIPPSAVGVADNFVESGGNCLDFLHYLRPGSATGPSTMIGSDTAPIDAMLSSTLTSTPTLPLAHVPRSGSLLVGGYTAENLRRRNTLPSGCWAQDVTSRNRGPSSSSQSVCEVGAYEATAGF